MTIGTKRCLLNTLLIGAMFAIASGVATVHADERDPGFQTLDADRDGFITRAEASKDERIAPRFEAADLNKDERLDKVEYDALQRSLTQSEKLPPRPLEQRAP